jgi:oligopeptide transport system substrate-binding protein
MRIKRFTVIRRLTVLFGTMLLIASCTKSCGSGKSFLSEEEQKGKKIFNYVRTSAHRSLDPVKQFDEASSELISNIYDTLLNYSYLKRPYELVPGLVESMPEKQADGVTYIFKLRKGVMFNDDACFPEGKGRELNADDVIYSLKRFADSNTNALSYPLMQGFVVGMDEFREETKKAGKATDYSKLEISGILKIDSHSFSVKLTKPNPLAMFPFAMSQTSIVPREAVEKYGEEFERHPVGSGPFFIKELSRRGEMVLAKNPRYWETYPTEGEETDAAAGLLADAGKPLPFIDEVRLPLIEEAQPAILSFQKGELDMVGIDKDNFSKFMKAENGQIVLLPEWKDKISMYAIPGMSMENFKFNMKDPLVGGDTPQKKALRQAIAYALNVQGYVDLMMNGRALVLKTIVPHPIKGSEWSQPADYYTQNKEMAKQKLAEAGYPEGQGLPELVFEYRAATTQTRQQWEFVRNELASVGIKATANFQTFSAWLQKTELGNYQISGAGWMADYPDAENFYQLLYGPNVPPGPNDGSYNNAEYNKLYEEIRFMEDGPDRYAKMARMNEIVKDELPVILLYNSMRVGLVSPWMKNLKRNNMYNPPLKYVDVDLQRKAKGI